MRVYKVSFFRVREVGVYKVHLFLFSHGLTFFEKSCICFFAEMRRYNVSLFLGRKNGSLQGLTFFARMEFLRICGAIKSHFLF